MDVFQLLQGVGGVGDASPAYLQVRHLERLLGVDREARHLQAVPGAGHGGAPMWGLAGWDEYNAVEPAAFDRGAGRGEMPDVDRVERAAEDADPHGWYSNSISAIRTVSPGFTPAASSAWLTPRRSSSD